jgi:mannose-6-phosphate isomerase-like protein (cupin superfamily)
MTEPSQTDPQDLRARMNRYLMRRETRQEDWEAFSFEGNPKARRAQLRYIGGGASARHDDPNTVPAEHFTLSVMLLPPGAEGAAHGHDVEEIFFVLQGQATCFWYENGVEVAEQMGPWDMLSSPAGVLHGFRNESPEPVYIQVMLGEGKPPLPTYDDTTLEDRKRDHAQSLPHQSS